MIKLYVTLVCIEERTDGGGGHALPSPRLWRVCQYSEMIHLQRHLSVLTCTKLVQCVFMLHISFSHASIKRIPIRTSCLVPILYTLHSVELLRCTLPIQKVSVFSFVTLLRGWKSIRMRLAFSCIPTVGMQTGFSTLHLFHYGTTGCLQTLEPIFDKVTINQFI